MCISLLSSKMRFLTRGVTEGDRTVGDELQEAGGNRDGSGSTMRVQILYRGLLSSVLGILDGGTFSTSSSWKPSPAIDMVGGILPLLTASVSFRFTAIGAVAAIDDVYLDPMRSF